MENDDSNWKQNMKSYQIDHSVILVLSEWKDLERLQQLRSGDCFSWVRSLSLPPIDPIYKFHLPTQRSTSNNV